MKVFEDTSPKHRHALGFAAISSGLWVERAVTKTMAFSFGRAMPRIGRARRCGPSQVVIMQVEMRSMFFQMKDNCSASDRFEFEAEVFSFIVLPVCEGHPLISHPNQKGGRDVMFPPRAARRQQRRFPGTEPGTKKCWVDVQPIRVRRVVVVWRIQFPPSDALRLNRDGPPLSRLFFRPSAA
jgi:hypothetical protein